MLISLGLPTREMRKEAASAGFYRSPFTGKDYPKVQLLTIEEILSGKRVDLPSTQGMDVTFKRAPRVQEAGPENLHLFGAVADKPAKKRRRSTT